MKHIFLYGPSGAGKSTVGRALADSLDLPFVDSDQVLESLAGRSIPEIAKQDGMETVRDLETQALRRLVTETSRVIALGGGALLRDANRRLVEEHGRVVLLRAELPTLVERLQKDANQRPLLAGDLQAELAAYLAQRAAHYASFPFAVPVDGCSVEQLVAEIQIRLGRHRLSAMGRYDAVVGPLETLSEVPLQNAIVVTDANIAPLHLERLGQVLRRELPGLVIPSGEAHKNLETVHHLWKAFLEHGLDRKSTVIALGGGVIGDLAGFAAATYMRGIAWIAVPTTLLAMVDAALGGKTGFDLPAGKNLIGAFHPPQLVLADPQLLQTLPEREFRAGLAEVVKHGIISDPGLFELCGRGPDWIRAHLDELVCRAMAVKIRVIEADPYEQSIRATLNLGHTVGHAVELVSRFALRHGEAVAIGTVAEARYAERIGLAEAGLAATIRQTLQQLGLPVDVPPELPREAIRQAMRVDKKKSAGVIRFALPAAIGRVELVDVADLESVLEAA